MKFSFVLTFICVFIYSSINSQCPPYQSWEKFYIPAGIIECKPDTVEFLDNFSADTLNTSLWNTFWPCSDGTDNCPGARVPDLKTVAAQTIRRDENVVVENGVCKLKTTDGGANNNWLGVYKRFNGGFLRSKRAWSSATFEAKVQATSWPNYWETFWLWNNDEIDIVESPGLDSFRTNFYPRDNDPCDITHWKTFDTGEAVALNNYKVRLTPFKMSFFFNDDTTSYFDLYRYYNTTGQPMDLDCDSIFPAGIYYINPRFPSPFNRWFRPMLNNKVHNFSDPSRNHESPFEPDNAIMVVDDVKVTKHFFDVCGSLQYQLPENNCSIIDSLIIMPLGDQSNHLLVSSIVSSANIEDSLVLVSSNQLKGRLHYRRLDANAGFIDIDFIDECGHPATHRINIPALASDCLCELEITKDFTINASIGVSSILVTNGAKLTINNAEVTFLEDSQLSIEKNASLEVNSSVLRGCNVTWQGVVTDTSDIFVKLANGSMIRDANIGIKLLDVAINATVNPVYQQVLDIDNSIITNCQIGIKFGPGTSTSHIHNNATIRNNNTGILYENHSGLIIDETQFYGNIECILSIDGYMHIRGENQFENNVKGIRLEGTYPTASGIDIGDMGAGYNLFKNNEYFTILSEGSEHPAGVNIVNCKFENDPIAALFSGANDHKFYNNEIKNSRMGLYAGANGDNDNESRCNEFYNSTFFSHYYEYNNSRTQFLENHFLNNGALSDNYNFHDAKMSKEIGSVDNPAANCFSPFGSDFNTIDGVDTFTYYYFDDSHTTNCQEPEDNEVIIKENYFSSREITALALLASLV